MSHDELLKFNFDTYERFSALVDVIGQLPLTETDWLLDVGGRPGSLARTIVDRRIVTADLPDVSHKPYVRASGAALPFRDKTFSAVITSDTLEHVPPQFRESFLRELWRVSHQYVIISGPFDTACVRQAEDAIRNLERESPSQATEWLTEHAQFGLPDLAATWGLFSGLGAQGVIVPGGTVLRWFMLFAAQSILEGVPSGGEHYRAFMPAYNAHFATDAADGPAYRHMLIFAKNGAQMPAIPGTLSPEQLPSSDDNASNQITALATFLKGVATALRSHVSHAQGSSGSIEVAYVEQIERALKQQESRLQSLEQQLAKARSGGGLKQRLRGFLDRS